MISASLGAAFVASHLSAVESEVAGFVPASGRSPIVILLEIGDPVGERAAAALRARCVELRACTVLGRPVAWAIASAVVLGYGEPWSAIEERVRADLGEWRERMRLERAAYHERGEVHPSDWRAKAARVPLTEAERAERRRASKAAWRARQPADRERDKMRARRAAMTLEERRAVWRRHANAKRARDRAARSA